MIAAQAPDSRSMRSTFPCRAPSAGRWMRGAAAVVACAAALLLAFPARALAHAHLRESTPAAGSTVDAGVREVRLRFSEGVEPAFTSVTLTGPGGATASTSALTFPADGGGRVAVLPLAAALAPGRWTVAWKAAAADGHASHGTFSFTVRGASTALPVVGASAATPATDGVPVEPRHRSSADATVAAPDQTAIAPAEPTESMRRDSPVEVAVRWLGLMALLAMVGAVAFRFAALRGMPDAVLAADVERRTSTVALGAALLSAPAMLGRLWAEAAVMDGGGSAMGLHSMPSLVLHTAWGHAWMLQLAATVVFTAAILLARRGAGGGWTLAALPTLVLAAVPALSGHAAAADRPALAVALDWVHVLGASVWLGMLFVLLAAGIPAALARRGAGSAEAFAALVNRFSPVAMAGAVAAAATGIGSACLRLDAVSQLWTTDYGRALLVKLGLLVLTACVGGYNWRTVRPSLGTEGATLRLRASARAEIALGALALLATAVLVAMPMP
ncbi:MAG: copper resistance domain protein [Gemmatimonadetes bacterium]|nr:copper resistance domain protein [Gemmatimonadota bacterium]